MIQEIKAVQDSDCHWYIIHNSMYAEFLIDNANEDMADSGEFDNKYGKYRTGGDLNNNQLYAEI